jgi:probable rRNA maturation factor
VRTDPTFSIINKTKGKLPGLPFENIKNDVLGREFDLSLVFVGDKRSRSLNKKFLGKDKSTNVLAFPLGKNAGEIFVNLREVERSYKKFSMGKKEFCAYLVVHGMLHLKGYAHGSRMEGVEKKVLKTFKLTS